MYSAPEWIFLDLWRFINVLLIIIICLQVNDEWTESCALWTAVVARSGSRRSAVLHRLSRAARATLHARPASDQPPSPGATTAPLRLITDDADDDGALARRLALCEDLAPTLTPGSRQELRRTKRGYDDPTAGLSLGGFIRHDDLARLGSVEWVDMFSRLVVSHPVEVGRYHQLIFHRRPL